MHTGNTYGEAFGKMNDAMIAECTAKIRAAGISEKKEKEILARGMSNELPSIPLNGKTISAFFTILMAAFLLGLFLK